jgi:signal transduction histidine kinase
MIPSDKRPDALEQLNNLGQLSAGVGHHVINAFSAVVSNAELLRLLDGAPGPLEPAAIAEIIVNAAMEASSVARRLIDYSRSATAIGNQTVALDELVRELAAEHASGSPAGVTWKSEIQSVPPIHGNELQLRTLLCHLCKNAIEAVTPREGTITLTSEVDQRGWVIVEVRDSGCGMSPEVHERAFEPFFTTKPGHFGVGLSIANGIWRRHRGTMSIRTAPGDGTTVRLAVDPRRDLPKENPPARTDASLSHAWSTGLGDSSLLPGEKMPRGSG